MFFNDDFNHSLNIDQFLSNNPIHTGLYIAPFTVEERNRNRNSKTKDMTVNTKTYSERAETHASPVAQRLFRLMELKKTNLCASIDVDTTKEFLELIDKLGPYVCLIKTHIDIINDFSYESNY